MIQFSHSDLRRLFPNASSALLQDLAHKAPLALGRAGVLDNSQRLAHFLAQASVETGGLLRVVESLRYSAKRIVEVFGPGVHSAKIGAAEAQRLAGDEIALGERVYGLGNPKKAAELGNVEPGDGFAFRGRGYLQMTGRANYARYGAMIGAPLESEPGRASDFATALEVAAAYWAARNVNAACDSGDVARVTKLINGGRQGLRERQSEFTRLAPLVAELAGGRSWRIADPASQPADRSQIASLQKLLNESGYDVGAPDGLFGPRTRKGLLQFQRDHALPQSGVLDGATQASLQAADSGEPGLSGVKLFATISVLGAIGFVEFASGGAIASAIKGLLANMQR